MKAVVVAFVLFGFLTFAHADKVLYVTDAGDTTVVTTITAAQRYSLAADILSIPEWIQGAIDGKAGACRTRMITKWMPYLQADPEVLVIPKGEDDLIEFIVARSYYEDRATAEARAKTGE